MSKETELATLQQNIKDIVAKLAENTDSLKLQNKKLLKIGYSSLNSISSRPNTKEVFRTCEHFGFDACKGDVAITQDGVMIMCHDPAFVLTAADSNLITTYTASAASDVTKVINDTKYEDIKELRYDTEGILGYNQQIATLDDYLKICKELNLIPFITLRAEFGSKYKFVNIEETTTKQYFNIPEPEVGEASIPLGEYLLQQLFDKLHSYNLTSRTILNCFASSVKATGTSDYLEYCYSVLENKPEDWESKPEKYYKFNASGQLVTISTLKAENENNSGDETNSDYEAGKCYQRDFAEPWQATQNIVDVARKLNKDVNICWTQSSGFCKVASKNNELDNASTDMTTLQGRINHLAKIGGNNMMCLFLSHDENNVLPTLSEVIRYATSKNICIYNAIVEYSKCVKDQTDLGISGFQISTALPPYNKKSYDLVLARYTNTRDYEPDQTVWSLVDAVHSQYESDIRGSKFCAGDVILNTSINQYADRFLTFNLSGKDNDTIRYIKSVDIGGIYLKSDDVSYLYPDGILVPWMKELPMRLSAWCGDETVDCYASYEQNKIRVIFNSLIDSKSQSDLRISISIDI